MKALSLLVAFTLFAAPMFAEGTAASETTARVLQPRVANPRNMIGSTETLQLADRQSERDLTSFAINTATGLFFSYTGLYLNIGGGYARMTTSDFSFTTPYNEVLSTTKNTDGVPFGRLELCYQFDENWDLALGFTRYGTAEVQIAFPKYPNIVSILPLPDYKRHVMLYQTTRISLMPTYSIEAGDRMRFRFGAGVMCNKTKAHIESTYYAWFSGVPNRLVSDSHPAQSRTDWSGIVSIGADYEIFRHGALSFSLAYAPYRIGIPTSPFALGQGMSRPSKNNVRVDALEAALALNFRR
ncbi:MAG: hypothetical protein QM715_00085 [Nibricoccus sp.]